jgi:hypothetical protein
LFKDRKPLEDVAIEMDLDTKTILFYYENYLRLLKMGWLVKIYNDLKNDFPIFLCLHKRIKKEGLSKYDIAVLVKSHQQLQEMEHRVNLYSNFIRGQQLQKQQLEQEINKLKSKKNNDGDISSLY